MTRGARSKLTQARGDAIIAAVRAACFRTEACLAVGVAPRTLRLWEQRARSGEEPYASFIEEVEIAEATAIVRLNAFIYAAGRGLDTVQFLDGTVVQVSGGDWHAAARLLEALAARTFARTIALRHQQDEQDRVEARAAAARVRAVFASVA